MLRGTHGLLMNEYWLIQLSSNLELWDFRDFQNYFAQRLACVTSIMARKLLYIKQLNGEKQ